MAGPRTDGDGRRHESRRAWWALLLVLAIGLVLRVAYLHELRQTPDFASPSADAAFHDYWARALTTGDWSPPDGAPDPDIRGTPFLRPPGYPYVLAAVYALGGDRFLAIRILQMMLGLATGLLAFLLGRAVYGSSGGVLLAAMTVVSWTGIYFEGELLAPALATFLLTGVVLVLARWRSRPGVLAALVAGLLVGATALVRPNLLLLLPAVCVWMLLDGPEAGRRTRRTGAALLAAGCLAAVAPATVRNLVVARSPAPITASAGVNLYLGNHEGADGYTLRLPEDVAPDGGGWSCFSYAALVRDLGRREGRDMTVAEADAFLLRKALAEIRRRPGRFLGLTLRRAALFWGPDEVSSNKAMAIEREHSRVLRRLPGFPWVLGLALLGLGLLLAPARATVPPARAGRSILRLSGLVIATVFLSTVPFLAAGRFRAPIVPLLLLFAVPPLLEIGRAARRGDGVRAALLVAAAAGLIAAAHVSWTGYRPDPAWWRVDRALAYRRIGDPARAETEFRAALAANPASVDAHVQYAALLAASGRPDEAARHYATVLRERPQRRDVQLSLAVALVEAGRPAEALPRLLDLRGATPDSAPASYWLGRALAGLGRDSEAIAAYEDCRRLAPRQLEPLMELGRLHSLRGEHEAALAAYRRAAALDGRDPVIRHNLAGELANTGRFEEAAAELEAILRSNPADAVARDRLARIRELASDVR